MVTAQPLRHIPLFDYFQCHSKNFAQLLELADHAFWDVEGEVGEDAVADRGLEVDLATDCEVYEVGVEDDGVWRGDCCGEGVGECVEVGECGHVGGIGIGISVCMVGLGLELVDCMVRLSVDCMVGLSVCMVGLGLGGFRFVMEGTHGVFFRIAGKTVSILEWTRHVLDCKTNCVQLILSDKHSF